MLGYLSYTQLLEQVGQQIGHRDGSVLHGFLSKALCYLPEAILSYTRGHPALTFIKGTRVFLPCHLYYFIFFF